MYDVWSCSYLAYRRLYNWYGNATSCPCAIGYCGYRSLYADEGLGSVAWYGGNIGDNTLEW